MNLASAFLEFGIHTVNALHRETYHGLIADLPGERLIVHSSDVQVSLTAIDACVGGRSAVAKGLFEAAYFGPPI